MINDKVVVGDGYNWKKDPSNKIMAYKPRVDGNGQMLYTPDGSVVLDRLGGVVVGSTGIIKSQPINVHRTYLHNGQEQSSSGYANDMVKIVAVFLDEYQQEAWFPVDNIRIFGTNVQ